MAFGHDLKPSRRDTAIFNFAFSIFNLNGSGGLALESNVEGSTAHSTAKALPDTG